MPASRRHSSASIAAVAVALLIGGGLVGLRSLGALEAVELAAYDQFMRLRPAGSAHEPRIVLITITERDLHEQGTWPLPDVVLARALETLASYGPRAIGLDLYRDIAVPPGTERRDALLRREPRIIAVTKFAEGSSPGVGAPPALRDTERVGFNDIVVDPGGTVRRGLLFLDDGRTVMYAFALRLALLYLQPDGVTLGPDPRDPALIRLGGTTIPPLDANDGPYIAADARGYQVLLDFRSGRGRFAAFSLGDLLSGRVDPGSVRDRIVLVGVSAESVKDDFYTPYSAGLGPEQHVAGVEIHAHIASQLLRMALDGERPMASLREWQEWIWVLLWSGLGALGGLRARSPWRLALLTGVGLSGLFGLDYVAFLGRWWLPLVPAALGLVASAGLVVAYVSYQENAQRTMLMQLFSKHVSKEVAEAIWREREQFLEGRRPRPQRLVVTALFTDLTGFTTVSERLSPEALMEWLNEYMDAMAQEISRYGGVIRQYAGDSIVAIFGVPVARRSETEIRQDAVDAVRCALAMEARLLELNRAWLAAGRPLTGMRVGIFTGPAVAGSLGSAERSEYVVVGDTINTASRLESFDKDLHRPDPLTRPSRTFVGETTVRWLGGDFETEWVGDVSLKGKEHTVGIYRVIGRAEARTDLPRWEGTQHAPH
jgi:adenylate cyclase